jgi:hypothetical protein
MTKSAATKRDPRGASGSERSNQTLHHLDLAVLAGTLVTGPTRHPQRRLETVAEGLIQIATQLPDAASAGRAPRDSV